MVIKRAIAPREKILSLSPWFQNVIFMLISIFNTERAIDEVILLTTKLSGSCIISMCTSKYSPTGGGLNGTTVLKC